MTGTEAQIEWAERIRSSVRTEFDRVENALFRVAERQPEQDRADTMAILAILKEKRSQVLETEEAGYFIRLWQELSDQVRKLLAEDSRYQAIQAQRRGTGRPGQ